ncbi:MAG: hypothetical protein H7330_01645 [Hymenobacteraceae bacterium]|nr:hypothetical protein [Hymenobacteraceae bacterium]
MITPNDTPELPLPNENEQKASDAAAQSPTSQEDLEKLAKLKRLADEADANATGRQLGLGLPDEIGDLDNAEDEDPFAPELAGDRENPKESYDLYYAIRRLLMRGLPIGSANKKLRQEIYDEKNLYLRGGVPRPLDGTPVGADSRKGLLLRHRKTFAATQAWADREGSSWDIFWEFYTLNKAEGFR